MICEESKRVATRARALFQEKFLAELEVSAAGKFVCIEPESEQYFLGKSFDEAVNKAIDAYPDRLTHTLRVGHAATLHFGVMQL